MQSCMKPSSVTSQRARLGQPQSCGEIVQGLVTVQLMFDESCLDAVTCETQLHELLVQVQKLLCLKQTLQTLTAAVPTLYNDTLTWETKATHETVHLYHSWSLLPSCFQVCNSSFLHPVNQDSYIRVIMLSS